VFAAILILQGFREGLDSQLRSVALQRGADLIAAQAGVENMVGARSVIPQMVREQVESVEGVDLAHPMTTLPLIYEEEGRKSAIFLVVIDTVGGPREVVAGHLLEADGEILIDRGLASIFGLVPGDDLTIAGYDFEIAGIVEGTSALWTPFAFSSYDSLIEFYFESNLADDLSAFPLLSYLLIRLEPGADPAEVTRGIEEVVPDVDVFTPDQLALNDRALGRTMLGAVLAVLIGLAYLAGTLVVALFMFTTAEGRRRDLGIMKALGFPDRSILISVAGEALLLMVMAIPLGVVASQLTASAVNAMMPVYLILPTVPGPLLSAIAACGAFALIGAIWPLHFIRGLEPGEVFRG
jgi:putative ABC transport system permease protein